MKRRQRKIPPLPDIVLMKDGSLRSPRATHMAIGGIRVKSGIDFQINSPGSHMVPIDEGGLDQIKTSRTHQRVDSFQSLSSQLKPLKLLHTLTPRFQLKPLNPGSLNHRRIQSLPFLIKDAITHYPQISSISAKSEQGKKRRKLKAYNQDAYLIRKQFWNEPGTYLLAICDGHGDYGHCVSQHITQKLPDFLESAKPISGQDFEQQTPHLLKSVASSLQQSVSRSTAFSARYSGSTLLVVLIRDHILISANIGDSRAILISQSRDSGIWFSQQLTTEHKPDSSDERERIEINRGRVAPLRSEEGESIGPARVWVSDEDSPGLAMSRSIGDTMAHTVGVISDPEVTVHKLDASVKAVVLGSDGLWDVLSNADVLATVQKYWDSHDCERCCQELVKAAETQWTLLGPTVDDITAVTAFFQVPRFPNV